jgi:hypothetical protein
MRPLLSILALCIVLVGCGATQRQKTITATLAAVDAARDGFVEYDRLHQQGIVNDADSADAARSKLDAYRRKREPLVQAFTTAYRALAIAAALDDDPKSLATMLFVARQLCRALEDFGADVCKELPL